MKLEVMKRSAVLSEDKKYRYKLTRRWRMLSHCPLSVTWIMLNPSTADSEVDDATIRRCMDFSARWGGDRMTVVNLFARRATDPRDLWADEDPIGPDNAEVLEEEVKIADLLVAAWGNIPTKWRTWTEEIWRMSVMGGAVMNCLGTTMIGWPRHPLYLRADTTPEVWYRTYSRTK